MKKKKAMAEEIKKRKERVKKMMKKERNGDGKIKRK